MSDRGVFGIPSTVANVSSDKQSLWLPKGYLASWDAALAAAQGGSLIDVSVFGDSTTYGQTASGGPTYNASNYSLVQKLRALAIAAGYGDGGVGNTGYQDSASMNTIDGVDPWVKNFSRADTGCGTTSGSNVVTDAAILATDIGRKVTPGAGFGANGFVGSVTPGVSFAVVTAQGGATALNATGTTTATMTLSGDGFAAGGFYGPNFQHDPTPANATQTGFTTVARGFGTTCRLGYVTFTGATGGSFTYSVDGGAPVTVNCNGANRTANYVTITGLAPGTLHTLTITVTVAGSIEVWVEWVKASGVVWNKHGVPGQTIVTRLPGNASTAFAMGIGVGASPANAAITLAGGTGPRNTKLAILWEGGNDMAGAGTQAVAINAAQTLETAIGIFAAYCANAGIPGIVCVPAYWYFTNALLYAPFFQRATIAAARGYGIPWIDLGAAIEPITAGPTYGASFGVGPHLSAAGYDAVANYLWTNLLNPATAAR